MMHAQRGEMGMRLGRYPDRSQTHSVARATSLAWDIIQLLERPGTELPELTAIREACRAASQLHTLCDLLRQGSMFDLDPDGDLDELPDGAFIPPPE